MRMMTLVYGCESVAAVLVGMGLFTDICKEKLLPIGIAMCMIGIVLYVSALRAAKKI